MYEFIFKDLAFSLKGNFQSLIEASRNVFASMLVNYSDQSVDLKRKSKENKRPSQRENQRNQSVAND